MNVDLERSDIANLLAALNAVDVSGKERMLVVLRLMQKLETALRPSGLASSDAPEEPAGKE